MSGTVYEAENELQGCVVVIDDDEPIRHVVGTMVQHATRSRVESFADASSALDFLLGRSSKGAGYPPVDAILCDIRMPGMSGHEFLLELRSSGLDIPVIFLTGFINEDTLAHALRLGAFDVIAKPTEKHILIPTVEIAINVGRRRRNMWHNLFAMKKRLSDAEFTPELAFEMQRAIEEVQKEYRMTGLLTLRNHSLKSGG